MCEFGDIKARLQKAEGRLSDPGEGGSTIPYSEYAALEVEMAKVEKEISKTIQDFRDSNSILGELLDESPDHTLTPVQVIQVW